MSNSTTPQSVTASKCDVQELGEREDNGMCNSKRVQEQPGAINPVSQRQGSTTNNQGGLHMLNFQGGAPLYVLGFLGLCLIAALCYKWRQEKKKNEEDPAATSAKHAERALSDLENSNRSKDISKRAERCQSRREQEEIQEE